MREWNYSFSHSYPQHWMVVSVSLPLYRWEAPPPPDADLIGGWVGPRAYWAWRKTRLFVTIVWQLPVPAAVRAKAWVCGRSLAGIAGSNPVGAMDEFPL